MDNQLTRKLLDYSETNISETIESQRELYLDIEDKINTFQEKRGLNIIMLIGLRGTGKSTLLKTIARKYTGLYAGGDLLKTTGISIEDLTKVAKSYNKQIIIIDEILYLSDWQITLKLEADSNPNLLYIISGSSAMQLKELSADLSRRLDIYKLYPLSFREFLKIKYNIIIEKNNSVIENVFNRTQISESYLRLAEIIRKLPKNLHSLFMEYYDVQFPFLINEKDKRSKLLQLVERIVYKDLPQIENLYAEHLKNAELIIRFLATAEKVSYTNLATNLGTNKDLVIKIMNLLEKSELIYLVPDIVATRELRGNKKVLFTSSSIRLALNEVNSTAAIGFAREDMFGLIITLLHNKFSYNYSQNGYDFLTKEIRFEIGNNKKKLDPNTIVVGDFIDLDLKNDVLYVPYHLFALIV